MVSPNSKVVKRMGDFHLMYYTSGWLYKVLHWLEIKEWNIIDRIIAISEVMCDEIKFKTKIPKTFVALDPIDPVDFLPANMLKDKSKKIVMFHGLLTRNKNVDMLLDAANHLPEIEFRIIGDGPDKKRLMKKANRLNVKFFGWKPYSYMYSYINDCDIGVALRSNNPGNEYVVTSPFLQYSIMGKPCIVTRRKVYGDYPWQIIDADDLIEYIYELLDMLEEGEIMRKYVLEHHDAEKIAEQIWYLLSS
jgi:glycosyltransferase involved in cell wall biosynthesis